MLAATKLRSRLIASGAYWSMMLEQTLVDGQEALAAAQGRRRTNRARRDMGGIGNAALDHAEPGYRVARVHSNIRPILTLHPHHHLLRARERRRAREASQI